MYCLLNDNELKRIKKVEEVTGTDAEIIGKFIPVDSLLSILDDLLCEYNHKVEELEDLEFDLNNNYTRNRVDEYEEHGVSRNDFI
jgi:hypothetical protein